MQDTMPSIVTIFVSQILFSRSNKFPVLGDAKDHARVLYYNFEFLLK